jgi:xanthine dehydrogenase YagS FAD-binding subunit
MKLADFYRLPGDTPHLENQLRQGELVTAVVLPTLAWARRSTYLKIHDRDSHKFALASAAVAVDLAGTSIRAARIAVGGVATKPWRLPSVEKALVGVKATRESFEAAAVSAADGAAPRQYNKFKVRLIQRVIVRALSSLIS